jgi:hypothetical protein
MQQPQAECYQMLNAPIFRFTHSAVVMDESQAQASETGNRLFEHFISEAHSAAVGVAVIATAANALSDWHIVARPADIASFAPDSAPLRALLLVLEAHDVLDRARALDLTSFIGELDRARDGLDQFLDDCEAISAPRAALIHARLLQSHWRALARDTKILIAGLDGASPMPLPDVFSQNTRVISALLSGASNGLKPCLDDAGRLYMPPLPQRRRSPRRAVLQNCLVRGPHHLQTSFVCDASAGGLGLGRISGLKRGDCIRVDFANGRQFQGTVAWVTGSSAGMRFNKPLDPADVLIAV